MYKIATLILVLYVIQSIWRRSNSRARDVERLQHRVTELSRIVGHIESGRSVSEVSGAMLQLQMRDILSQVEDLQLPQQDKQNSAFEQLHYVEEYMSNSTFVPLECPTVVESTLH